MTTNIQTEKLVAALVGLAVGDAVGTTLEFTPHSAEGHGLTDMVGGGPFRLPVGAWTDDTSMALCLAESLLDRQGFDAKDQIARYARWARNGENSSIGRCFDIGGTCRMALAWHAANPDEQYVPADELNGDGNGALMRLAPIALFYHRDYQMAIHRAACMSRTTHGGSASADACAIWAAMILAAADERATKTTVLMAAYAELARLDRTDPIVEAIANVLINHTYATKTADEISGNGYVVNSFEAALWAWYTTNSFEAAVLRAANLGQDADTTAAICAQLAGAFYGFDGAGIPRRWREKLVQGSRIEQLARQLVKARA